MATRDGMSYVEKEQSGLAEYCPDPLLWASYTLKATQEKDLALKTEKSHITEATLQEVRIYLVCSMSQPASTFQCQKLTSGVKFSDCAGKLKVLNHTSHNQSRKWHRNGIKNPRSQRYESLKGVDPKFLRNMRFAKKHNKKGRKKMQANNAKAIKARAEAIKALSTKASKAKLLRPKIPKASGWRAGHKMASKRPGPRVGIKCPGSRITKPDSKIARTTDPKAAKPTDPKAAKSADPKAAMPTEPKATRSATKVSKSDPKATKSGPKATKSDAKASKSGPKVAKSDSKALKPSDSKAAKPTDPKAAESKPKDAGAKAASPKPSK
ncbi:histone H1.3-like [Trichosurus vulpecula]|uniref:histone H1.3-like n=1 Tax=Trichosurus vulpecula TaxID=9337 RepID=UPI00186AE95E|nr:histone H1.3-like [Trichosurus vulpecula]